MIERDEILIGDSRIHALVQNLADLVTIHDTEGVIRYATPSTAKLLGFSREELIGKNGFELIHPDDLYMAHAALARVVNMRNQGSPTEYRVRTADGKWLHVETVGINFMQDPVIQGIVLTSRDVTERKRHERELQAITTVAAALRGAPTRSAMLPIILDQVMHLLDVDGAALAFRDPISGETVVELGRGGGEKFTGTRLAAGLGVTGRVMDTGEAYRSENLLSDPDFVPAKMIEEQIRGPVAGACVPLKAHDETIGALWIERENSPQVSLYKIDDDQLQLLSAIADMAANAIHRATLNEQTELRLHRLTVLQAIDVTTSASADLQVTLNLLLGEITSRLGMDAADVLVMDAGQAMLKTAASRGFTTNFRASTDSRIAQGSLLSTLTGKKIIHVPGGPDGNLPDEIRAIMQSEGFETYYGIPLIASGNIVGVLELFLRGGMPTDAEWLNYLDGLAAHVAAAIEKVSLIEDLRRGNAELTRAYDGVIEAWSRALALRRHEPQDHARRVTEQTLALARLAGVRPEQLIHIRRGAMLHDIGKIALPDDVLLKAEPLSESDQAIVRRHPLHACELISPIEHLRPAMDIPYCHHERWDGSGYPRGLKGDEIPLAARIFSIIDVHDALTSDRPYRKAWPQDKALDFIREHAGTAFDPALVKIFLEKLPTIEAAWPNSHAAG